MPQNPEVDEWLSTYDNPMKDVVPVVRVVVREDDRISEVINGSRRPPSTRET